MSSRAVYLRDQAAKCRWHANNVDDPETKAQLQELAAEYIVQAIEIERVQAIETESVNEVS
jgi:hypothetical protein